jgi:hypothetical protein
MIAGAEPHQPHETVTPTSTSAILNRAAMSEASFQQYQERVLPTTAGL